MLDFKRFHNRLLILNFNLLPNLFRENFFTCCVKDFIFVSLFLLKIVIKTGNLLHNTITIDWLWHILYYAFNGIFSVLIYRNGDWSVMELARLDCNRFLLFVDLPKMIKVGIFEVKEIFVNVIRILEFPFSNAESEFLIEWIIIIGKFHMKSLMAFASLVFSPFWVGNLFNWSVSSW